MDETLKPAVALLNAQLREQEQKVLDTKRAINAIYLAAREEPPFSESDLRVEKGGPALTLKSDQFYGQPLASSIREILEMRRGLNEGPATVGEIFDALSKGGFKFETKNEENAKRGLRISLTKNTAIFHKLPNGRFGLLEWYPNVKPSRPTKVDEEPQGDGELADADDQDDQEGQE